MEVIFKSIKLHIFIFYSLSRADEKIHQKAIQTTSLFQNWDAEGGNWLVNYYIHLGYSEGWHL